jgi:hypothetical protein
VLRELARIGFADLRDVADWGVAGVCLHESKRLPYGYSRTVAEVTQTRQGHTISSSL